MDTKTQIQTKHRKAISLNNMKRSSSSNSDSHNHLESPHSPLRFHSPLPSDQGDLEPPDSPFYASPDASPQKSPKNGDEKPNPKAIVAVRDKFTQCSPVPEKKPEPTPAVLMNKAVREEGAPSVTKMGPGEGGERSGAVASILKRSRTGEMMKLANLGFRLSEVVLCLISFSVMAADKTQGWSGDSFDRYREYRYCLSVNVIGFVYSGFQAYDLAYYLATGKHVIRHHLKRPFDFFMDQILAYLLISASSAAATRVDDWQSNWGKDEFTEMASASVAMSFLAFVAFALSCIISGYNLYNPDSS
ncbi:CASP-like protein [Melia azedarach]|uniref:CASP-like protein n=1 Tax=Melia azedarach TaxID=155640 RepID=A0ACC1XMD1_MELAZ|nr:CASP-like protein [Melia azedarach]